MDGAPSDDALRLTRQIDRLRHTDLGLRDTAVASAPDALAALTACIRTDDRAAAGRLARDWLHAVERAVAGSAGAPVARRDRAALTLLARVLRVPTAYFTDADTSLADDDHLVPSQDAVWRGLIYYGPCRGYVPEGRLRTIHALLLRELERRLGQPST